MVKTGKFIGKVTKKKREMGKILSEKSRLWRLKRQMGIQETTADTNNETPSTSQLPDPTPVLSSEFVDCSNDNLIIGQRIVNLMHFFEELKRISSHGKSGCGLKTMDILSEDVVGQLTLKCENCLGIFVIYTDPHVREEC